MKEALEKLLKYYADRKRVEVKYWSVWKKTNSIGDFKDYMDIRLLNIEIRTIWDLLRHDDILYHYKRR